MRFRNTFSSILAASLVGLCSPIEAKAAPVQKVTCNFGSGSPCAFANPVNTGNLLLLAAHSWASTTPTDTLKNTWNSAVNSGTDYIWYTTASSSGTDSVSTGTGGFGELLEYSGFASLDVFSFSTFPAGTVSVTTPSATTTSPGDLVVGALFSSGYSGTSVGSQFSLEAAFSEEVIEDQVQAAAGPISANFTDPTWANAAVVLLATFKSTGAPPPPPPPPLPPPSINLTVTGTLVWDTGGAILPGNSFTLNELENGSQVSIGTVSSDANGNLSGTINVNPNFTDSKGNITLQLTLSAGIPVGGSETIQVSEFEQGSTGIVLNVVMFHVNKTVPGSTLGPLKSFSYALVP